MVQVDRLGEEVDGTVPHRLNGVLDRAMAGQDDHRQRRIGRADLLEKVIAAHAGHPEVGHHEVDRLPVDDGPGLLTIGSLEGVVALVLECYAKS